MSKDPKRGKPLLAVMIRSSRWLIVVWSVIAAYLILVAVEIASKGKARALDFLSVIALLLTYVLHPRVRFFEGGVEFPPANRNPRRFLRWDQIDRYSWDGDKLVLTGTASVLAGGPVEGDVFAIPASKR